MGLFTLVGFYGNLKTLTSIFFDSKNMLNHLPDEIILYVYPYIYLFHEKQFFYSLNKHLLYVLKTPFIQDKENLKHSINEWTLVQYLLKQDYYAIMYCLPFINRYFLYLIIHFTIENNNSKVISI